MRRIIAVVLVAFFLGTSTPAGASDSDFSELFWEDLIWELEEEGSEKPEEALLVYRGWDLGGQYSFSAKGARIYAKDAFQDSLTTAFHSQLFLDARPDPSFRVFAKLGLDVNLSREGDREDSSFQTQLRELFSDFNYANKIFFRAGKQQAQWGVGYFFSPADLISVGRLDPQIPEMQPEGPWALKMHYPRKSNNYYLYLLWDGVTKPAEMAVAPKLEYVWGKAELGLGGFFQKGGVPRLMLTASSSWRDSGLFGELVLSKGSDKQFWEEGELVKKDDLFLQATAGLNFKRSDPDGLFNWAAALQYYYNGEGTGRGNIVFQPEHRHNFAAALSWNQILQSKFSASAFWLGNLGDRSGLVSLTLSLPSWREISPQLGLGFNYGDSGTEYGLLGKTTTVFLAVTFDRGSF